MKIECTKKEWNLLESFLIYSECSTSSKYFGTGCNCIVEIESNSVSIEVTFED